MTASDAFKAGQLAEAIELQIQGVKANPADKEKRIFLFELLAFAGELDRARKQIDVLQFDDPGLAAAAQGLRACLDAEALRQKLFTEGLKPKFFSEVPPVVQLRFDAIDAVREGRNADAVEALRQADSHSTPLTGTLNGKPFGLLRDADDFFGDFLEAFARGAYYWVPLDQIAGLGMNPPKFPRDLLWFPARLTLRDGGEGDVYLPATYPFSFKHPNNEVKLGRLTEWEGPEGGPTRGVGSRTFIVDEDPMGLLEWRRLEPA
jgi:type VI secretion system protein ImpE